jgi:hypothetical protein
MRATRVRGRSLAAFAALALLGAGLGSGNASANPADPAAGKTGGERPGRGQVTLHREGTVNLRALARPAASTRAATPATANPRTELPPRMLRESAEADPVAVPRLAPTPATTPVTGRTPGTLAFEGLSVRDSRYADGGNQFTGEPPDQALCVGAGFVMEGVNTAIAVYDHTGTPLAPTVSLNKFFALVHEFGRIENTFGPSVFDPVCLYDAEIRRWIFLTTELDQDPFSGELTGGSHLFFAVSTSADPLGDYARYSITTTSGDRTDERCPCFDDFPHIGTDANGFYITANRFPIFRGGYNGAQIYAISKTQLAANAMGAADMPAVVSINVGKVAQDKSYTVQPAATPPRGDFANREYFLTTTREGARRSDRIGILALSNTDSLNRKNPAVRLSKNTIRTRTYVQEPNVVQKEGPAPLARLAGEPLTTLDSASAMSEVEYAQGRLWAATGAGVGRYDAKRDGVLWFQVNPSFSDGRVDGTVVHQGYVAVDTNSLMYPAIGVNAAGQGAMVMSMAGPTVYPSPSYIRMDRSGTSGPVRVPDFGNRPDDGFTCYEAFVGSRDRGCRWGDYSAGTADARGRVWIATEWISGQARLPFANWSTEVMRYRP